jgi:anti-sigma-K factor RskA
MSVHEQFAEDLALFAMGSLEGDERVILEKHLEDCSACRQELEALRGDLSLFALSASGPQPPQRVRQRLMEAVERERRMPASVPDQRRASWWAPLGWAAAASLGLLAFTLWRDVGGLRQQLASVGAQATHDRNELERVSAILDDLNSPDAQRVTMAAAKTPPQPQGKAIYQRKNNNLIFLASNLPPLPANKIYELWLIPVQGSPIAAGLFKPDARGDAVVVNPPLPAGIEAKTFAVTLEPAEGSHEAPRGTGVMQGIGE